MTRVSRRKLLVVVAAVGAGCTKPPPPVCVDETGLTPAEREIRRTLAYSDRAADPRRVCAGCSQYLAPKTEGACGACRLMKGPVSPAGDCKAFAPKA